MENRKQRKSLKPKACSLKKNKFDKPLALRKKRTTIATLVSSYLWFHFSWVQLPRVIYISNQKILNGKMQK